MRGDDLGSDRWFLGWQGVLREVQLLLRETQARYQTAHQSPDSSSGAGLRYRLDGSASLQILLQGIQIKRLQPWLFFKRWVFLCWFVGLIRCSSSTTWTGPWRRAGERRVRTASPEEPIWSASTTRRRKTSCLCTAKAPASGSASSATQQREASRMCVFTEWTLVEACWYTAKTTSPRHVGYSWSDGTPVSHTNWGHGEPNDHEGREECVEMVSSTNGTFSWWNDLNCDAHQDWICRITKGKNPIQPPVPPSPVPGK